MNDPVFFLSAVIYHLIFILIFSYLYSLEKKKYILLWTLSWIFFLGSSVIFAFNFHSENTNFLTAFEKIFSLLGTVCIGQGALLFFQRKYSKFISVTAGILIVFFITAYLMRFTEGYFHFANAIFAGGILSY